MYKKVLLPVDLNHESSWRKALPTALANCRMFNAPLHVVMVMPDFHMPLVAGYFPEDFLAKAHAATEQALAKFVDEHVPQDVTVTHETIVGGTVYARIIESAGRVGADMIVMAAYRPDIKDYLLGPNADRVVRHAGQTVVVVRD